MAGRSIWWRSSVISALLLRSVTASASDLAAAEQDPPAPSEATASFWAVPALSTDTIDVSFTDRDLVSSFRFLTGEETNVIAVGPVAPNVSVDLRQVTPGHALDAVLRSVGVAARFEDNTVFLSALEDRVVRIPMVLQESSSPWEELQTAIAELVSDQGSVALNRSGGVLTVSDRPADLDRLEEHVYEVLHAMTRQVEIEVQVIEAVYQDDVGAGINWALLDGVLDPGWGVAGGTMAGNVAFQQTTDIRENFQIGVLKPGRWQAFLDAFEERVELNIISRPRITALSNQPATFEVKEKIPYLTKTVSQEGGVIQTEFELQFDEAGIEVLVVASIAEGGEIAMEVHPIISSVVGFTASLPDLGPQPIIDTRETKSTVRLAQGNSLVMAGMMQDRENVSSLGVPVLSRIPYLGRLFRSEEVRVDKTEIIIVLTPRSRRESAFVSLETWDHVGSVDVIVTDETMPTHLAAARSRRAWESLTAGNTQRAVVLARGAAAVRPSDWWALNNLGLAMRQAGFLGDAERTLRLAVRAQHPAEPVALMNWGTLLLHRGRAAEAVEPLREAAARAPHGELRDEAVLAWALALEFAERGAEALEVLHQDAGGRDGRLSARVLPRVTRLLEARETASN